MCEILNNIIWIWTLYFAVFVKYSNRSIHSRLFSNNTHTHKKLAVPFIIRSRHNCTALKWTNKRWEDVLLSEIMNWLMIAASLSNLHRNSCNDTRSPGQVWRVLHFASIPLPIHIMLATFNVQKSATKIARNFLQEDQLCKLLRHSLRRVKKGNGIAPIPYWWKR